VKIEEDFRYIGIGTDSTSRFRKGEGNRGIER
jgi:hypothetical protein